MSQHDYVIDNNTGKNVRLDINDAFSAIATNNSGDTAPATTYPFMFWTDTSGVNAVLKIRNEANTAWIQLGDVADDNLGALLLSGGTMEGRLFTENAGQVTLPDLSLAGDTDTGWYSPGPNLLSFVAGGVELLRIDGVLGYVKLLGTKAFQLTVGTTAQRPTGVEGLVRANSDTKKVEVFLNSTWQSVGSASGYGAVVGSDPSCTHPNLAAALSDAAVVAGSKIMIMTSETVNSVNTITKQNTMLEFLPGVTFTMGSSGTGISIGASGCRIKGGRFSGFTTTAISIASTFQYNFVMECRFASCTAEVTELDAAPINVIAANITE